MGKSKKPEGEEEQTLHKAFRKAKSAAYDLGFDPSTNDRIDELVYQITLRVAAVYRRDAIRKENENLDVLTGMHTRIMDYENRYMDLRYGLEHLRNSLIERKREVNEEITNALDSLISDEEEDDA